MNILHLENDNPEGINYREIKKLIIQAFEKARSESKRNSKPGWYAYISDNLKSTSPSERTMERYYKKYIDGKLDEIGQPKEDIIDEISKWLGYENFADFCRKNFQETNDEKEKKNIPQKEKKEIITEVEEERKFGFSSNKTSNNYIKGGLVGLGIAVIAGLGSYLGVNGKNSIDCMYWDNNHYTKIDCNEKIDPETTIIPYNEQLFKYFFKIEATDTTTFFKAGEAVVWYVKVDGEPEFFSTDGKHPINGKELKKVTPYIIEKYVLKTK